MITFLDPGGQNIDEITTDDTLLVGSSTVVTTTEGTFTLTFGGQTTAAIDFDALAMDVETALDALSSIEDVSVTGSGTLGDKWMVTFLDPGAMDVSAMTEAHLWISGNTTIKEEIEGLSAPIDPTGVVYLGGDHLLVSDAEINEEPSVFDGVNLWEWDTDVMTSSLRPVSTGVEVAPTREPTGLAYNASNGHV